MSRKVCIGYINEYEMTDGKRHFGQPHMTKAGAEEAWIPIGMKRTKTAEPVYIDAPPRKRKLGKKEADEWCDAHAVETTRVCGGKWIACKVVDRTVRAHANTRLGAIIALRKLTRGKK